MHAYTLGMKRDTYTHDMYFFTLLVVEWSPHPKRWRQADIPCMSTVMEEKRDTFCMSEVNT
jgi:hypothetical protein